MIKSKLSKICAVLLISVMIISMVSCSANGSKSETGSDSNEIEEITVKIGSAWTKDGYTWTMAVGKYFMPKVDEILATEGNYKIKWVEAWGGTVTKVNEVLQTVQNGLLDVGWVGAVTQSSQLPLNNISYFVPFGPYDVDIAQEAMEKMHEKYPEMRQEYEKYNQKWLGSVLMDSYQIATNFPFTEMSDLDGKKIGAAGTNMAWFSNTGCVAVQSPGTEAYSSIQTGVYDGTVQSGLMMLMLKLYEVAPHVTLGNFGATWAGALTVNMDFYDDLPEEVKDAFVEAGQYYMKSNADLMKEKLSSFKEEIENNGGNVQEMNEEQRIEWANLLTNIPYEYVDRLNDQGLDGDMVIEYLHILEDSGYNLPRKWYNE